MNTVNALKVLQPKFHETHEALKKISSTAANSFVIYLITCLQGTSYNGRFTKLHTVNMTVQLFFFV